MLNLLNVAVFPDGSAIIQKPYVYSPCPSTLYYGALCLTSLRAGKAVIYLFFFFFRIFHISPKVIIPVLLFLT